MLRFIRMAQRFVLLTLLSLLLLNICLLNKQQQQRRYAAAAAAASPDIADNNNLKSKAHAALPYAGDFFPALNEFSTHTVIRPQLHHGRHKRALQSTLDEEDGLHIPHITLSYLHEGQKLVIDLKRNDRLLPSEHFLRYQNSNRSDVTDGLQDGASHIIKNFTKTEISLCHYQGTIRGKPNSSVAISTCNGYGGINGVVYDGIDTFFIHSGTDGRLQDEHFLFRHSDMLNKNATCGYDDHAHDHHADFAWQPSADVNMPNRIDGSEFNRILRYKRSYDDNNVIRGPYNANKHSSYVELVIVVDNKVYKMFGENMKKVHQHCKDLANIVNALYVPLNIFVALVGVVIWNESNEIEFSSDGDVTLRNFLNYRKTKLVLEHPNDNAQLLTKEQFAGGVVGKALKGPICTHEYSGGVSMQHSPILAVVATTMAHEMGHNFGMEHDSPDCKCQDEKCIMAASSTAVVPVHWSSCSIDQLNIAFSRGMNYCLRNKPTKLFDSPQCGNGFVEPGEQCDCGLPNYCENTCCDPHTCMLHTNASCATGECCDLTTCRPKVAGSACRIAENECDLPEYCTGESEYCPADVYKRDTEECDNGQAYCFQGNCRSHSNQCRILWGPTGESSEHCYWKNTEGKRSGNCGYNRLNNTYIPCGAEHVACGMLHCRHLNERLEFGMESAAELSHSFINHGGIIVPCRTALVDLGLQSTDPGLTPNGAKCGEDKMCVNQKCRSIEQVHADGLGQPCPENCNGNGVCNSRGNCHCDIGFAGSSCLKPGPGGSIDSGPATNPNSHEAFQRFIFIFFFAVVPFMALLCVFIYYCRRYPFFWGGKLENILKSATAMTKQPPSSRNHNAANGQLSNGNLPKSTPSSTDDMNSALLKSASDSSDATLHNGMYGKFKGFTLRPLNDTPTTATNLSGANVAYVQPTIQHDANGVPQRPAPPPPATTGKVVIDMPKANGTLGRKAPVPPVAGVPAPALPPPNPGSNARPIISMPVLENSTNSQTAAGGSNSPMRAAPTPPHNASPSGTLKPAPPPPVPLHADPKLNMKRDGTIRRIASFLKKDDKPPIKEKTYIDREKLRNLEISAPMPVATQATAESSNSDSETTPREEETKNLVKRAQSMRSPTKSKVNLQTFGSMRQPNGVTRPKSVVNVAARPKSPPPRPPPLLKKTMSSTSSGYQMPIAAPRATPENTYDDCEFVELHEESAKHAAATARSSSHDNIYSVIEEIPPAASTLKRSDLISGSSNSDIGLLGEIVNEIEKRNGESLYTGATLTKAQQQQQQQKQQKQKEEPKSISPIKPAPPPPATAAITDTKKNGNNNNNNNNSVASTPLQSNSAASTYLRPAPVNAPIARVAPTRSDISPTTAFSSFKPVAASTTLTAAQTAAAASTAAAVAATSTKANAQNRYTRQKSFGKSTAANANAAATAATTNSNKTLPTHSAANATAKVPQHSATIQKPKPLSAKPSFSNNNQKKTNLTPGAPRAPTTPYTAAAAAGGTTKSNGVAALSQRFDKAAAAAATTAPRK